MTTTRKQWRVGQTVFVVDGCDNVRQREAVITKIGKLWATIRFDSGLDDRFSLADSRSGCGPWRGTVYASRQEHEEEIALEKAWNDFSNEVRRTCRAPCSKADIERARVILFGEMKDDPA